MTDFISVLEVMEPWHWLSVAIVLVVVELAFVGAYFLLCIGAAAAVVGAALFVVPDLVWQAQIASWAILSIAGIVGWSIYRKGNPTGLQSDEPLLNNRAAQYVGREFSVDVDVPAGDTVQQKLDDSYWSILAKSALSAGDRVRVTDAKSTVLIVEPAPK